MNLLKRRRQRILDNMPIKHIGTEPISPDISIRRWDSLIKFDENFNFSSLVVCGSLIRSSLSLESEVSLPRRSKTQSILGKIFPWMKENSDPERGKFYPVIELAKLADISIIV